MAPSPLESRRTQNTLLFQKLLNLRDGASPFTLILQSLEGKGAKTVVEEFMSRAKISKAKVVFVSFRTVRRPKLADVFIRGHKLRLKDLRTEILSNLPAATAAPGTRTLLIIDTLNPLCNSSTSMVPTFLSSLLSPTVSLLATYNTDLPNVNNQTLANVYHPNPLTTLTYLATSILTLHSLPQTIAKKAARDRSLQEPAFGLDERREGILMGFERQRKTQSRDDGGEGLEKLMNDSGVVVEMEIRRKSGRGVRDVFVLIPGASPMSSPTVGSGTPTSNPITTKIMLLDDHPLYAPRQLEPNTQDSVEGDSDVTFSLSLTEKQRRDREGIVLPYFDAQREEFVGSSGEGGRILYDMGREDDFDEEEDEI